MDRTDLRILREMLFERAFTFAPWNPRISAAVVAARTGLATSTVSDRIRAWRRDGFMRAIRVIPHPELFGARLIGHKVRADTADGFDRLQAMLHLVPNVVHALEMESTYWVFYMDEAGESVRRGEELFRTIPGIHVFDTSPIPLPPCSHTPSPLDWRILESMSDFPDFTVARVSRQLGVSPKTVTRRLDRLISGRAVLFQPIVDWTRSGGVVAGIDAELLPHADLPALWKMVEGIDPVYIPDGVWSETGVETRITASDGSREWITIVWSFDSAAEIGERARQVAKLPGVKGASWSFPARSWTGVSCAAALISKAARSTPSSAPARRSAPSRPSVGLAERGKGSDVRTRLRSSRAEGRLKA
jgi:DNA-binding Lrp family transcriptional regulator